MVCRMIHSIYNPNTDIQFELFNMARNKFFGHGGDMRMKHTLPALVYATLRCDTKFEQCAICIKKSEFDYQRRQIFIDFVENANRNF